MRKIAITQKQALQFNRMRNALKAISKGYMTPDQIRKDIQKGKVMGKDGLDYEEYLEMSYENIQDEAAQAVKGVKKINVDAPDNTTV